MKKFVSAVAVLCLLSAPLLAGAVAAQADTVDGGGGGYAAWTLSGTGTAYTGSVTLNGGFPGTTFTSNSRQTTVQAGKSVFLPAGSAPGAIFGSSANQQYLNQRPLRDNVTSPSTTTYTFDRPTPASGWGFVLGDIDADKAVVSATDAKGNPVSVADLGFKSVFNYCDAPTPRPCTGDPDPGGGNRFDLPVWDPATATLLGSGFGSNQDTAGASGWFMPTVPLTSLTIRYYMLSGFPVYQTWFATVAHDISGTVSGCVVGGVPMDLKDANGFTVASTVTDANGNYAFTGFVASDDYTVSTTAPDGCEVVGEPEVAVDLSVGDVANVDFEQSEVVPTQTATPTSTATETGTPTGTASPTATATASASASASASATGEPTTPQTPSPTAVATVTGTDTLPPTSSSTVIPRGLAETGASSPLPVLGGAALLLALGAVTVSLGRRRHRH